MGTIIGYEAVENHLKMICNNKDCRVHAYAGEPLSTNTDGVEPSIRAYQNPLFAHVCIACNSLDVSPVPIYEESEPDLQEMQEVYDETLREHELRQQDYESMLPFGSRGVEYNDAGEPVRWD